jgi:hypothetical protein
MLSLKTPCSLSYLLTCAFCRTTLRNPLLLRTPQKLAFVRSTMTHLPLLVAVLVHYKADVDVVAVFNSSSLAGTQRPHYFHATTTCSLLLLPPLLLLLDRTSFSLQSRDSGWWLASMHGAYKCKQCALLCVL